MERAGDKTLAQWIRGGDTLSLDLIRRFGENLLSALEHLEQEGIAHRDIKPDNIGIAKASGTGAYRLVLFDFSLSRAPAENIQAGTRPTSIPSLANVLSPAGTFTRNGMRRQSRCMRCSQVPRLYLATA